MRSLENKDTAMEEERVFSWVAFFSKAKELLCYTRAHSPCCHFILCLTSSDRLDKLEKDKARLAEQLITQQREAMVKEIDMLRKRLLFLLCMLSWLLLYRTSHCIASSVSNLYWQREEQELAQARIQETQRKNAGLITSNLHNLPLWHMYSTMASEQKEINDNFI